MMDCSSQDELKEGRQPLLLHRNAATISVQIKLLGKVETMKHRSDEEIELIKQSSLLVGKAIAAVAEKLRPGITTASMDTVADEFIRSHGGIPAFKGFKRFPASICVSVNAQVVHGIPGKYELKEG